MITLITKVLGLWSENELLAAVDGPYLNEVPADAAAEDYAIYSVTSGRSSGYVTSEPDERQSATITFTLYTREPGRELEFQASLDRLFDRKAFDLSDGHCELSRRTSATIGSAGQDEQRRRVYRLTYALSFDFHTAAAQSREPLTE